MSDTADTPVRLTEKQRLFVEHYLACLNGAEAARRAGYSSDAAREIAYENLTKPHIRAAIDARLADVAMPPSEILYRLGAIARADLGDFFTVKGRGVSLDIARAKREGLTPLLKKYSKTKQGVSIELHDQQAALVKLGEYYGLWRNVTDVTLQATVKGYAVKDASPDAWDDDNSPGEP